MSEQAAFKFKIPPAFTKYLKSDAPKDARMMAAKGLVPMAPPILASVLTFFLGDTDPDIQKAATETLSTMPKGMVQKIVSEEIPPKTLDFFARLYPDQDEIVEKVLLNRLSSDETFQFLAERTSEKLSTIIANNQVRLLRLPAIAQSLRKNSKALRSEVDRVVSFLRINGVVVEGESPELTAEEIEEILNAPEIEGEEGDPIPEELLVEVDKNEVIPEAKKLTLYQAVQKMNVAKKIKLALKGNKEARSLLIKDSNKIVASSVVKSPKITEGEVYAIAQLRTAHDEVIRLIAGNPEWTKNYNMQVALSGNPKTPFPVALKFTRTLRVPELEKMSRNKNVSGQLSKIAKELYEKKRG